jgi:hypothetical protein
VCAFSVTLKPVALNVPLFQSAKPIRCNAPIVAMVTALATRLLAPLALLTVPTASMGVVLSTPVQASQTQPWSSRDVWELVNPKLATLPIAQKPYSEIQLPPPVTVNPATITPHPEGAVTTFPLTELDRPLPNFTVRMSVEANPAGLLIVVVAPGRWRSPDEDARWAIDMGAA